MATGFPDSTLHDPDLDFLVTRVRADDEHAVRRRLQRMIVEAVCSPNRQAWEAEASLNYQYTENDFYTAEELADFAERGQPPTRRNEIAPIIEQIAGRFIQTRHHATFLGRNTPADDGFGAVAQDYQRHNDQLNEYEFEEQDLAWDGMVGGVGWLKSVIKKNELGQKYESTRVINPFHVFKDPYATKYNPNHDAKYIVEGSWMDLEDVIALVPDQEAAIRDELHGWNGYDAGMPSLVAPSLLTEAMLVTAMFTISTTTRGARRRVRPFEVWYKRKIKVFHLFTKDGVLALPVPLDSETAKALVKGRKGLVAQPDYQDRLYVGLMLGNLVLHHDVSPHETNLFPYIPFYSGLRKNGYPLALCSRLVPINEAINKRESKALALLSNRQTLMERNAVEDEDEFTTERAKPDGVMLLKEGALSGPGGPKVVMTDNLDLGQGQMALLGEDKDALRRVSGQGNEAMGMPSEVRSGTGIARKQMMSSLIVTPLSNNLKRTRQMRARLSLAYMKQYLTEEVAFQITDDPNAARTVAITKGHLQSLKTQIYDVVITEMKDYATLREQQAEMLLTALPQLAQHGTWLLKLGIQLSELREKDSLMRMIDEQSQPPPIVPKMSLSLAWADLTPEEKAYMAMQYWKTPELAQAIMQKGDDPAFVQKLKASLVETAIKEGTRGTIERGKMDLSALSTAVEGRMAMREIMQKEQAGLSPGSPMEDTEDSV